MTLRIAGWFAGGVMFGSAMKYCYSSSPAYALSPEDFQKAMGLIDGEKYSDFPKNVCGRTRVLFPPGLPIVLKESGSEGSDNRIRKMNDGRHLLKTIGAKHLIIPDVRKHGEFLIEDRLPLGGERTLQQMGMYVENKETFTSAIRELTTFFCYAHIGDLKSYKESFAQKPREESLTFFCNAPVRPNPPVGRFDNIPLFLENGVGKIGLIDLESLSILPREGISRWWDPSIPPEPHSGWEDLITIFPYHYTDILEVVGKIWPDLRVSLVELENRRNEALLAYETAYCGHRKFLDQHQIHHTTNSKIPEINDQQIDAVKSSVKKFLEKWYNYDRKTDFYNRNPRPLSWMETREMNALVNRTVPIAIASLQERFQEVLSKTTVEKEEDLVFVRTFIIPPPVEIEKYLASEFRMIERNDCWYADLIFQEIVREMKKQGILYEYIRGNREDTVRV